MMIEHRIILLANSMFREEIPALKKDGFKTEPAFAKHMGFCALFTGYKYLSTVVRLCELKII